MAESGAGRSTVLRALSYLEMRGFMTRRPQFHDSGARRSTRYYLNHPRAQDLPHSPDPGPPSPAAGPSRPMSARGPSHIGTGAVSERHSTGVPNRAPLNPSTQSPSEPDDAAAPILAAVIDSWKPGARNANGLLPAIKSALARGWPPADLTDHLLRNPNGARDPIRVLARRLTDTWQAPDPPVTAAPWCGECEDPHSRTITVTDGDGREAAQFFPQCSPQAHRDRSSVKDSVRTVERW